ncbi:MAG: hypothetical protein M3Z35_09070 [Nitrospirota bacterium]|nr:hypothetical protein [Nitrospirota bacterium]
MSTVPCTLCLAEQPLESAGFIREPGQDLRIGDRQLAAVNALLGLLREA